MLIDARAIAIADSTFAAFSALRVEEIFSSNAPSSRVKGLTVRRRSAKRKGNAAVG
jgi:hypothetical protein